MVIIYIASLLFAFHTVQSYILLTANLDDLHSIVKELAEAPVSDQIGSILRRAYTQFQLSDLGKKAFGYKPRADDDEAEMRRQGSVKRSVGAGDGGDGTVRIEINPAAEAERGKESYYIKSINKVLENIK